jgi:hypothetical protein
MNRRLTLNLGARYDLYTNPYEQNNNQANYDIATGQLLFAGVNGNSRSLVNMDKNNVRAALSTRASATGLMLLASSMQLAAWSEGQQSQIVSTTSRAPLLCHQLPLWEPIRSSHARQRGTQSVLRSRIHLDGLWSLQGLRHHGAGEVPASRPGLQHLQQSCVHQSGRPDPRWRGESEMGPTPPAQTRTSLAPSTELARSRRGNLNWLHASTSKLQQEKRGGTAKNTCGATSFHCHTQ